MEGTLKLRISTEFTNFALAILLFAGLAAAAVNVNTAENAEIAAFIENESKRVLQVPDSLVLNLNFQTAKDEHSRAGILFFVGKREVSIKAIYTMDLPAGQFKGTLLADTSWFTGYCGVLECLSKPMPAEQRIDVLKTLVSRLLAELNGRLQGLTLAVPALPAAAASDSIAADSVANAIDTTANTVAPDTTANTATDTTAIDSAAVASD